MPSGHYKRTLKYKDILTNKFLIQEYKIKKFSSYQIAKMVKCNPLTVLEYLRRNKIRIRTSREGLLEFYKTHPALNLNMNWKWSQEAIAKESQRRILSGRFKGKNHPNFGKPIKHTKRIWYKNIGFRSSWEVLFAQFLDLSGIKWLYEPKTFDLGNTTYTPDFYIPEWDCYIEIKGWWRGNQKQKFYFFKTLHPTINIKLLFKQDLKNLSIL